MRLPAPAEQHGRSLLPILEQETPAGRDEFFFSHTFHEINNYYPMRGIRTRTHKYVRFLYPELEMPLPSDLFGSTTWRGVRSRRDQMMGQRQTAAVLHHAKEELYNLESDPNETMNIVESPAAAGLLAKFRQRVRKFRSETEDPWFIEDQGLG
jgi:N-sulfoglucosamine sulfohydrolase